MRQVLWAAGICVALVSFGEEAQAQRYYKGQLTSCPEGTRPVPETDNCVPLRSSPPRRVQSSCPPGTVPVPETDNCVRPRGAAGSTVCFFNRGPRAGGSFDFALLGFKPIPVGSPCNDGLGSTGTAGGRF